MIRNVTYAKKTLCSTSGLYSSIELQPGSPVSLVLVRWRMPRWVPSRPRKLYFIPEKPKFDPEETIEMRKLNNVYNTHMTSTLAFLREKDNAEVDAMLDIGISPAAKKVKTLENIGDHILKQGKTLDRFNAETHQLREEFLEARKDEMHAKQEREMKELQEEEARQREIARLTVQQLLAESEKFVTEENLHEKVEKMLTTTKNYNFVIDLEGNRYIEMPNMTLRATEANKGDMFMNNEQTD